MAGSKITINDTDSVFVSSGDALFPSVAPGPVAFTENVGAYLITTDGAQGDGLRMGIEGAWAATINGTIYSATGAGAFLPGGNSAASKITVGADANVFGSLFGLDIGAGSFQLASAVTIANAGDVEASTSGGFGILLDTGGAHTVTNTGTVGGEFSIDATSFTTSNTVTNSGVFNGDCELDGSGAQQLTNSGSLNGDAVFGDGTNKVTNASFGLISGLVDFGDGANTLGNSGVIGGGGSNNLSVDGGDSADTYTNSATMAGGVLLGDGVNALTNSGSIGAMTGIFNNASVAGGSGADTVTNTGDMSSGVNLGGGLNKFTNSGSVGVDDNGDSYVGASGNDTIINSKTLSGGVSAGDGVNTLTNSGSIGDDNNGDSYVGGTGVDTVTNKGTLLDVISLGDGNDVLTNSGHINGDVDMGAGNDTFTNTGTVGNTIDLGTGDDTFTGGNNGEFVQDNNGADTYKLGGGNDTYIATGSTGNDSTDTIDGGTGIDTYDASAGTNGLVVNIDTVDHSYLTFNESKNTATGDDVDLGVAGADDIITNFENVVGGNFANIIFGSAAANVLQGGSGSDVLFGFVGNDTLIGNGGSDKLTGGAGKDTLTGGGGGDTFVYTAISDSGTSNATRDVITDFVHGTDLIDLSQVAVNGVHFTTYLNGDSHDTPAAAFTGVAGQLRSYWTSTGEILEGDINGDKHADFSIALTDPTHAIHLTAADLVLT